MNPLTSLASREDVERLQAAMSRMPQINLPTQHYWADGMYCRVLPRLAGTLIVGKVHKREHIYIVCSGTVRVVGNGEARTITGPAIIVSSPGTKRAVLALTDATCLTVHRTDLKDLDAIERELLEEDPQALFDSRNEHKLELLP
jgi:hypothetical protein